MLDSTLTMTHKWAKSLDRGVITHVIYLIYMTHSSIANRKQRVLFEFQYSHMKKVTSRVPKGSILGHLFFLVCVNDINFGLISSIRFFADDYNFQIIFEHLLHLRVSRVTNANGWILFLG